jgi:PadR family transcriptional regulator PadR
MTDTPSDLVQGTLDMMILKILALEPLHGFGITRRVEQVSKGVFLPNPGSLLPALRRMERTGWVRGSWRTTANNRRARYYAITEQGRLALARETREWERQVGAVARILQMSKGVA